MDCNAFGAMVVVERFQAELGPLLREMGIAFGAGIAAWKDWMIRPDDLVGAAEDAMGVARAYGGDHFEVHHR